MRFRSRALLGAVAVAAAAPATASAAQQQAYAVGLNYATPAIVVNQGDTLQFNNIDVATHTLSSSTPGLFDSGVVSAGNSTPVAGVDKLAPRTYQFFCAVHPWV